MRFWRVTGWASTLLALAIPYLHVFVLGGLPLSGYVASFVLLLIGVFSLNHDYRVTRADN